MFVTLYRWFRYRCMLSMNLTVRVRRRSSFLSLLTKYIQFEFQSFLKKNYICKIFILRFLQRNFSIFPFDKCDESNPRFGSISMEFHFRKKKRDRSQSRLRTLALPPFDKAIRASRKVGGSERKEKTGDPDFTADLRFDRSDRGEVGR